MTDLKALFEAAAQDAKDLPQRPDNRTLLELYSLYKQATVGDATGERPGLSDLVERFKYDAWAKLRGMPPEEAMQRYADLVSALKT